MSDSEREGIIYAGDQALKDPADDKFNRAGFAKRVSRILTNKQDSAPLVIGIYGKWGEGKTSVVNFIKHYLDQNDEIIYLDFNPWRYNDEDELLNSFFKQFSQGISKKLGVKGKEIAKGLLTYSGLILAFAEPITGLSVLSSLGWIDKLKALFSSANNFVSSNDLQPLVDSVQESLENSTTLERQKENINEELKKTGKKHVVFIDDIDRLDNKEIQLLFRIIKLTADFENVIYVLSFDPEMVAAALDEKYPGNENESGLNFLEKIIQVPLKLPKVRRTDLLNDVMFPGINNILETYSFNLTDEEARNIGDALQGNLEKRLSTPRMVKRYLNGLTFALPILQGEANPHDIILMEGLRICYPDAYDFVYQNRELFISDSKKSIYPSPEEAKEEREKKREDFFNDKDEDLKVLLENLFPRIGNSVFNITDKELAQNQRVCSPHYFERYFTYSVPKQDIRDQDFQQFLETFSNGKKEKSLQKAKELIEATNDDKFVRKIEENKELILNSFNPEFAIVLSKLGHYFSKRSTVMRLSSPLRRVSNLIRDIILNVSEDERFELSKKVLDESTNIVLATELGRHLHKQNNEKKILKDEEHEKIIGIVTEKIRSDALENGPFYKRKETKNDSTLLFNIWEIGAEEGELNEYMKDVIGDSTEEAIQFLKSFISTGYSPTGDELTYARFEIDAYNYVKKFVDPEYIYQILKKEYASVVESPQSEEVMRYEGDFKRGLAMKFAYYYLKDQNKE